MTGFSPPHVAVLVALSCATAHAGAQRIDTTTALAGLRDAAAACALDGASLWGASLCGPVALVHPRTRLVIANDTIAGRGYLPIADAYVSTAPSGGFANTSVEWEGRRWATILLPLSADRFDRVALVMHEVFHREQAGLGLVGADPPNGQLDEMDGRRLLRLELRALAAAILARDSSDAAFRRHVNDALLFRARRHALYPAADTLEPALEIQEGLAEYTGDRLAVALTGQPVSRVARRIRDFETNPTFVRSFAYATGPGLGFVLDRVLPTWRSDVRTTRDPARLLAAAMQFHAPRDLAGVVERRAADYGGADVAREEAARDSSRRVALGDYRRRLVTGRSVTLRQNRLSRSFNPQTLMGFDSTSTIYPTGSFGAEWGTLDVRSGGALVSNDYHWLRVAAPAAPIDSAATVIEGEGWTMHLNPGWRLEPSSTGYEVVQRDR